MTSSGLFVRPPQNFFDLHVLISFPSPFSFFFLLSCIFLFCYHVCLSPSIQLPRGSHARSLRPLNHRRTPALRFATLQAISLEFRVTERDLGSFSALIVQIYHDLSISSLFSGPWRTPHCLGCVVVWIATGRHGYSFAFLL